MDHRNGLRLVGRGGEVCPSNRKTNRVPSTPAQAIGIDRLAVSYPCAAVDERGEVWHREVTERSPDGARRTLSGTFEVGGTPVFVSVQEVPQSGLARWWGKVELNPSRVVDPDGVGLATVADLPAVMSVVRRAATGQAEPKASDETWPVKRLDVARDFTEVEDPGRLIRGLGPVHRPWSRKNLVHADSKRNRAQTLMVGSGAGVVRLYDKAAESGGRVPYGTVRWEAECRRKWLRRYAGVETVADITNLTVGLLARDRWEWSAMGVEVASSLERFVSAAASEGMSERERAFFVGWLICEAGGSPIAGLSNKTVSKYRRLQKRLGIAAPVDLSDQVQVVSRLDWDSGREVVRVA